MLEAVIFDMDGVVSDSEPGYAIVIDQMLMEEAGAHLTPEFHNEFKGNSPVYSWTKIMKHYGLTRKTAEEYADEMMRRRDFLLDKEGCDSVPGTRELILSLHEAGIPMVLASAAPYSKINRIMDMIGLSKYMKAMLSGCEECEKGKPDPELFYLSRDRLGVSAEGCVVIDDGHAGIVGGNLAGMKTIRYLDSLLTPDDAEADLNVRSMCDITLDVLKKLAG